MHHREAREGGEPAAHQAARRLDVGVAAHVDVGAEGDGVGIEARRFACLFRKIDAPLQPLEIGAQGEHHALGMQRRHRDHLRSARGNLDRHLGVALVEALGDPADAAGGRRVVQVEFRHGRRPVGRCVDLLEAHRLAAEIGP